MAFTGASFTAYDAVLKEDYKGPIRDQLNNASVLIANVEKNTDDIEGSEAVVPLRTGRNWGIGARAELAALPEAGQQSFKEIRVTIAQLYGRIQLSGKILKAAKSNRGSFTRALQTEVKEVTKDCKRDTNRQVCSDGSGILADCGTTTASTTVQLASDADMRWLETGMKVDARVRSSGAVGTGGTDREITATSTANKTITISGAAITTDSTYSVYIAGNRNAELMGTYGIVDDRNPGDIRTSGVGNLYLDVASYPIWKATRQHNSGTARAIEEDYIQNAISTVEAEGGGQYPTLIYAHPRLVDQFAKLLLGDRRYENMMELKGGFRGVRYAGSGGDIPIVRERDTFPKTSMYVLHLPSLVVYEMQDWDWMEEDGAVLSRISGKDAYEAVIYCYKQLACTQRNANARVDDLEIPA